MSLKPKREVHGGGLRGQLAELRSRKDRLDEAFLYGRTIDRATYDRQRDKLAEEATLGEMARHQTRLDDLDVKACWRSPNTC